MKSWMTQNLYTVSNSAKSNEEQISGFWLDEFGCLCLGL